MGFKNTTITGIFCILTFSCLQAPAKAEQLASTNQEDLAAAVGHFARARTLLIEAVREFDRGYKISDPSALIDAQRWRTSLIDKAEEIEKVLDPQPRASKSGVKFGAQKDLLNEAKD